MITNGKTLTYFSRYHTLHLVTVGKSPYQGHLDIFFGILSFGVGSFVGSVLK